MPLSSIAEGLLRIVFEILFEIVFKLLFYGFFYSTGWVLVKAFTIGRVMVSPRTASWLVGDRPRKSFRQKIPHQKVQIGPDATCLIGILFWCLVIACLWIIL